MHIPRLTTSHAPVLLVSSRSGLVSAAQRRFGRRGPTPLRAPLLPKLRGQLAEFLDRSYLDRLGILYLSTCVGLGYGRPTSSLEVFLVSAGSATSTSCVSASRLSVAWPGFAWTTAYTLAPGQPSPGLAYPAALPHRWPTSGWVGSPLGGSLSKPPSALGGSRPVQEYQPVFHRLRLSASP